MKLPFWLRQSEPEQGNYQCPLCKTDWRYYGPRNPCHWQCPICNTLLTWVETEQLEPYKVRVCSRCGADMIKKLGRNGLFWSCLWYPDCSCTRGRWEWRLRATVEIKMPALTRDSATELAIDARVKV